MPSVNVSQLKAGDRVLVGRDTATVADNKRGLSGKRVLSFEHDDKGHAVSGVVLPTWVYLYVVDPAEV